MLSSRIASPHLICCWLRLFPQRFPNARGTGSREALKRHRLIKGSPSPAPTGPVFGGVVPMLCTADGRSLTAYWIEASVLLTRSQSREHGPSVLGEWMDWCESTGAMPRQQQQTQPNEGESWDQISKAGLPCRSRAKFPFLRVSMFEQHCTPYITRLSLGNLLIRSNSSA